MDWEAELVIQMRTTAFALRDASEARDHIGCWGVGNDLSDRWWQSAGGGQWLRSKSFPGFAPHNITAASPAADFCLDRRICCWLNDELVQDATLSEYLYPPELLLAALASSLDCGLCWVGELSSEEPRFGDRCAIQLVQG